MSRNLYGVKRETGRGTTKGTKWSKMEEAGKWRAQPCGCSEGGYPGFNFRGVSLISSLRFMGAEAVPAAPLQLISSSRGGSPGRVSGARWTQGGTGLPGQSTAMRQRWPMPKGKGCAPGTAA